MTTTTTAKLMSMLSKRCVLESFTVQGAEFDGDAVDSLAMMLEKSRTMRNIDLAWTRMMGGNPRLLYRRVLEALSASRKLQEINLSWNNFGNI